MLTANSSLQCLDHPIPDAIGHLNSLDDILDMTSGLFAEMLVVRHPTCECLDDTGGMHSELGEQVGLEFVAGLG